jgi:hypothetical protein
MISDLFELRQVLLGLVEGSASSDGASHHGHTLQLCSRVQLHVGTAWVRIVPVDSGHSTSTNTALRDDVAGITLLFLSFLVWHKDGWQLGLYETRKGD